MMDEVVRYDYAAVLLRAFDDRLEKLGTAGDKFERWCTLVTERLQSESHAQYQEGLEWLGQTLGYQSSRPKYNSATDCRWRGIFGNVREVVTFEAKIEHKGATHIVASDVGQAHNQLARATSEYKALGFAIRGTIVTHLNSITPDADAALGTIRVIPKDAILQFWLHLKLLLSLYRDNWSMDDFEARIASAQKVAHRIPSAGWMIRVLDSNDHTITQDKLLSEWK